MRIDGPGATETLSALTRRTAAPEAAAAVASPGATPAYIVEISEAARQALAADT